MRTPFQSSSKPARFFGIALSLGMSLATYGSLVMPAASAAAATVPVDQQPLTVQPVIPPNIVLMLDDSQSMAWVYMPDWDYLSDHSDNGVRNSAVNGIYYDPYTLYDPPPKADGTEYPDSPGITQAYADGFRDTATLRDVTTYSYGASGHTEEHANDPNSAHHFPFYSNLLTTSSSSYPAEFECPGGYHQNPLDPDQCIKDPAPRRDVWTCHRGDGGANHAHKCKHTEYPPEGDPVVTWYDAEHSLRCPSGGTYDPDDDLCHFPIRAPTWRCTHGGSLDHATHMCVITERVKVFTYVQGTPYVQHYVAAGNDCDILANASQKSRCVNEADISGASAPAGVGAGQNVANWFSYYRTRMLTAKTGLMKAFAPLDPLYRLGFASINAGGVSEIPADPAPFTFDNYFANAFGDGGSADNKLAVVQPFGDGTSGTQKAKFWDWIVAEKETGQTPLRKSLDAAGQYYQTDQPWTSMPGDSGYDPLGSNPALACRASYTIMTTDGFWNGDSPGVGDVDGVDGPTVTGPNQPAYTRTAAQPYSDTEENTLADVAMKYWQTDLQPALSNRVPTSNEDPAFWQHMVSFTMGMGFKPVGITITPATATIDDIFAWANGGTALTPFAWPTPAANSDNNIADLAHAGVNGHGAFFSAGDPEAFAASIASALQRVAERIGTGASLAANSTELDAGTVIYQANYYTSTWKGELKALDVDPVTGVVSASPTWLASGNLPAAGARIIKSWNPSSETFVDFKNDTATASPPDLSTGQLAALGSDSTAQQAVVDYLRGDPAKEQRNGGTFRSRTTPLGDIVDSQPVYVGAPNPNEFINQSFLGTLVDPVNTPVPFFDWAAGAAATRTPLIYVASNDGMLHAFDTTNGKEVFAYLPGAVITAGLKSLSDPSYGDATNPHQFYNDGQMAIADAYFSGAWHTVLVGTTGRGTAKAVYALDVTDPSNITPMWERSAGDGKSGSDYIGQMVGKPVIAQTSYKPADAPPSSTWSVLIGNGYNSAQGVSALLQFDLATGDLYVHPTGDTTTGNGLAAPLAWLDNPSNGVTSTAYAGDRHGQVWSFKLNDTTGANPDTTSTGALLFTAKDGGGLAQPITAGMLAGRDPATGDVWLLFGTGQYLSLADLDSIDTQTWYGIIVQSSDSTLVTNLASGRSALVQREITGQTDGDAAAVPPVLPARSVTALTDPDDMDGKSGWYMDLLAPADPDPIQQGERTVDSFQFQGGLLIGATRIPKVSDVCNPGGSGWVMALDPFTGTAPSGDFFDVNGDGSIDSNDRVDGNVAAGVGFSSLPNAPIFVGAVMETSLDNGTVSSIQTAGTTGTTRRVNWRELVNP